MFYIVTAKAVLDSRKTGVLQINPIPFPFTLTGTICWVVYSTMTSNYYVYIGSSSEGIEEGRAVLQGIF